MVAPKAITSPRTARKPAPPPMARRAVGAWWALLLSFSALEVVEDKLRSTYQHPTLSVLLDPALNAPLGRFGATLAWLAFGSYVMTR